MPVEILGGPKQKPSEQITVDDLEEGLKAVTEEYKPPQVLYGPPADYTPHPSSTESSEAEE